MEKEEGSTRALILFPFGTTYWRRWTLRECSTLPERAKCITTNSTATRERTV